MSPSNTLLATCSRWTAESVGTARRWIQGGIDEVIVGGGGVRNRAIMTHLAVVFNGAQAQFYVNGVSVAIQPLAASISARGNPLNVGADKTPAQFHKGLLDEIRIYNRALTSSGIQTDMVTRF